MKWAYYFILLSTYSLFVSLLPGYSLLKDSIELQFGISKEFIGFSDMLSMFGRVIASIYLTLMPARYLNKVYFICVLIQALGIALIFGMHFFPFIAEPLYLIGLFIFGLGRGVSLFPYLLLLNHFSSIEDRKYVNMWFGVAELGSIVAYLLVTFLLQRYHWILSYSGLFVIFLITGILTYLFVPESERQIQNHTIRQEVNSTLTVLKEHYKQSISNKILLVDFNLQENHQFEFYFWMSYYFMKIGFGNEKSAFVSLTFPIGTFLGSIIINTFVGQCPQYTKKITVLLLVLGCASYSGLLFLENDVSNFSLYILFLGLGEFCMVFPLTTSITTQVNERVENPEKRYVIVNFMRLVREVFTGLMMLLTGFLMEKNVQNFLYKYVILAGIILIVHVIRRIFERKQEREREEGQNGFVQLSHE